MSSDRPRRAVAPVVAAAVLWLAASPAAAQEGEESVLEATDVQGSESEQAGGPVGVDLAVGPLVSSRTMHMRLAADTVEHAPELYVGGALRFGADLVEFESADATLSVQAEGGYAASKNEHKAGELRREPTTEATFLRARLVVRRSLGESTDLELGLGGFADSYIVEPNLTYTGHRYLGGEVRAGLNWTSAQSGFSAAGDVSALPVFALDASSGAYGEGSSFGGRAGVQLGYDVFALASEGGYRGGRASLRYDYTRFQSQFPEARLAPGDGLSEDVAHGLTVLFGYFL